MSDIWLTPEHVVKAVGPFDLDPCAAPAPRPWATAAKHYDITQGEDGLALPWDGCVWLNPPYSDVEAWVRKLADHGHGVALTFARTSSAWFGEQVFDRAAGLYFLQPHLFFHYKDGTRAKVNGGAPSVLSAYGEDALRRLAECKLEGRLVVMAPMILTREDGTPCGSWREAVNAAMSGRPLKLRDIYRAAEGTPKVAAAKAAGHNWKAQIRRTLQRDFAPLGDAVWGSQDAESFDGQI